MPCMRTRSPPRLLKQLVEIAKERELPDIHVVDSICPQECRGRVLAYLKVLQSAYKQLQPTRFEDLSVLEQKKLL